MTENSDLKDNGNKPYQTDSDAIFQIWIFTGVCLKIFVQLQTLSFGSTRHFFKMFPVSQCFKCFYVSSFYAFMTLQAAAAFNIK